MTVYTALAMRRAVKASLCCAPVLGVEIAHFLEEEEKTVV